MTSRDKRATVANAVTPAARDPIEFRPHHFLCTLGFEGKGYSDEFVRNYAAIARSLRESGEKGELTPIRVVRGTDSVCAPCPNRSGSRCLTESKIQKLDDAHSKVLGIAPGDTLSWKEAKRRIASQVSVEDFNRICEPCSWRSLGVCEKALLKLKQQNAIPSDRNSPQPDPRSSGAPERGRRSDPAR